MLYLSAAVSPTQWHTSLLPGRTHRQQVPFVCLALSTFRVFGLARPPHLLFGNRCMSLLLILTLAH